MPVTRTHAIIGLVLGLAACNGEGPLPGLVVFDLAGTDQAAIVDLAAPCPWGDAGRYWWLACGGPSDCSGAPCCYTDSLGAGASSSCQQGADACPTGVFEGRSQVRLCHADSDCTSGLSRTATGVCCRWDQLGATQLTCGAGAGECSDSCPVR